MSGFDTDTVRPSAPADQAAVRRSNLILVLNRLREQGSRSRASLAEESGLNKTTVSSLVAELVERGLVREVGTTTGRRGRPATLLQIDGSSIATIGLELAPEYIAAAALDLSGRVVHEARTAVDVVAMGQRRAMALLARTARSVTAKVERSGGSVVGVNVAVPGLVDVERGVLTVGPNLGWTDVAVADLLRRGLGDSPPPVHVDNEANLAALAEFREPDLGGVRDLVYVTGGVGIGAGVIVGGAVLRGSHGFAGEVGHMPLDPLGHRCGCGRVGCWEASIGLHALLRAAGEGPVGRGGDASARLAGIEQRADEGHAHTLVALDAIGAALGRGLSILVNLFDPQVVVLGGYFVGLGRWLLPTARAVLEEHVLVPPEDLDLRLSRLGFGAAVRGGAVLGLDTALRDPTLVPRRTAARGA